jgi:hypothetical protein
MIINTKAVPLESIQRAAYASIVTNTPTSPPDDHGIVAVVDGSKFLDKFLLAGLIVSRTPQADAHETCKRSTPLCTA